MSHHGSQELTPGQKRMLDEIFKTPQPTGDPLRDRMRQIAGEFHDGKLNAEDEGAVALNIGHERGVVKILFPKPVAWIGFTPDEAVKIAETLIKHARKATTKPLVVNL